MPTPRETILTALADLLCRVPHVPVAHSTEDGQLFHAIVGTHSTASRAAIPRDGGRLI